MHKFSAWIYFQKRYNVIMYHNKFSNICHQNLSKIIYNGTIEYTGWFSDSTGWTIGISMEINLPEIKVRIILEWLMRGFSSEFFKCEFSYFYNWLNFANVRTGFWFRKSLFSWKKTKKIRKKLHKSESYFTLYFMILLNKCVLFPLVQHDTNKLSGTSDSTKAKSFKIT